MCLLISLLVVLKAARCIYILYICECVVLAWTYLLNLTSLKQLSEQFRIQQLREKHKKKI